jgi:hypothetical protein
MDSESHGSTSHGLAFLGLLSFVAAFLTARAFATLNPDTVVVTGGIHFHHFWYGLAMIVVAGWLGIVHNRPQYRRFYAVLFGLGCGLVGDEVGLLLTFGDYNSSLTFFFFVIVVSGASTGLLLTRRRKALEYDVFSVGSGERLLYVGVVVAGLSALTFAAGYLLFGAAIVAAGFAVAALGLWLHRKQQRVASTEQKAT